ncbi:hypothetical protein DFH11DRAFT_1029882 [Phellopilus nigrolimitatus]|nr:hypothetical protein DFH11DRAFT_1029882 [Phellopilus nigrolimitatus]
MRLQSTLLPLFFALVVTGKHGSHDSEMSTSSIPSPTSAQPTTTSAPSESSSTATVVPSSTSALPVATSALSASSSAATAVPSNPIQFTPPNNATTCTQAIFTWEYSGTLSIPMTIVVTNERAVAQRRGVVTNRLGRRQSALVSHTISTSVDALTCTVTWALADVPMGQYTVIAFDTAHTANISAQSAPFFVNTGNDTACLNATSTATSTPASTGTGSNDSGSDPSSSRRGSKVLSAGAIAGTVAGVLAGVGGLLLIFSIPRLRRRGFFRNTNPPRAGAPFHLF